MILTHDNRDVSPATLSWVGGGVLDVMPKLVSALRLRSDLSSLLKSPDVARVVGFLRENEMVMQCSDIIVSLQEPVSYLGPISPGKSRILVLTPEGAHGRFRIETRLGGAVNLENTHAWLGSDLRPADIGQNFRGSLSTLGLARLLEGGITIEAVRGRILAGVCESTLSNK